MAHRIFAVFALLAAMPLMGAPMTAIATPNADCIETFYQTKDMGCIDALVDTLSQSADTWAKSARSVPYAAIGFFAEVFSDYPKERDRILHQDVSDPFKSLYLTALMYAGLTEEAKKYAQQLGWTGDDKKLQNGALPTLKQVRPKSTAADNDLLVGAYEASGNTGYILAILDNYTTADDAMVSDALRIGLVSGKFGPRLTAPGRTNTMVPAACTKYHCKSDTKDLLRLMTLATAFWSVHSLAQRDDGIKNTFDGFFEKNRHLKQLLAVEQNAFGNYLTMVTAYAGIKDNPAINSSLSVYENLGSAQDAFEAMRRVSNRQRLPE